MFARGLGNTLPTHLITTIGRLASPQDWGDVFVACSGLFRVERGLAAAHPELRLHGNDLGFFPTALARCALGKPLEFTFRGDLAFLEECPGMDDPLMRLAALQVGQNFITFVRWTPSRFRSGHIDHVRARASAYVAGAREKVEKLAGSLRLSTFRSEDFRDLVEQAIEARGGVIVIPPTTFEPDKPALALIESTDWKAPTPRAYDPTTDLPRLLERLRASGVPFFLGTELPIEGAAPQAWVEAKGSVPLLGYMHGSKTSFRSVSRPSQPFAYKTVELARLHKKSRLSVLTVPEAKINFLRNAYLKKGIAYGQGDYAVLVYIDDMLAGCISYRRLQGNGHALYVLTDLSVTREGRIAKLIARLATHRAVFAPMEKRLLLRFNAVRTAAFSDHPEAMKYRGSWEVESREELVDGAARYKIVYGSKPREEELQACYRWWWGRDGEREVGAARKRDQDSRSAQAPAA